MILRPFHRWKSFWLGLLVLAFLGWAWVRSMHHTNQFSYKTSSISTTWFGYSNFGSLALGSWMDPFDRVGLNIDSVGTNALPPWGRVWFPEAANLEWSGDDRTLSIAHWFLILLFLIPWSAFLGWRYQRLRRIARENPTPFQ